MQKIGNAPVGGDSDVRFRLNGKEALDTWGIYMGQGSLSSLMTPAPNKAYIESECADEDGKRVVVGAPTVADRDVTLTLYLVARSMDEFFARYALFCEELKGGRLDIETRYQPGVVYHCNYISCNQFEQWDGEAGKFTLRLNEPNPGNRTR